jgi:uncharacterized protein (DUF433 family)
MNKTAGNTSPLPLESVPPPLRVDEGDVVRVGKSRVSIDLVVSEFEKGRTPPEIVGAYESLELADVHAVISYYLRHREEVKAYLQRRENEAAELRHLVDSNRRPLPSKEELLTRRRG